MSAKRPRKAHWATARAADLFEYVTSGSRGWAQYYSSNGPAFIRIGNLDHGTIHLDTREIQRVRPPDNSEGERTKLHVGDILISITAELGMVGLVHDTLGDAYINQHIALARPKQGLDSAYLAWFFAKEGKRQLLAKRRGATKAGLGLEDIRDVLVEIPPYGEQCRIVAKLDVLLGKCRRVRDLLDAIRPAGNTSTSTQFSEGEVGKSLLLLDSFEQAILAKAFRGELVPQDPNDEPASVLLDRIRAERAASSEKGTGKRGRSSKSTEEAG